MYTRGFWNFQFRTAPSHAERARYFSTSRSGLWCIPKKPELLVSTTTLYPFLSHGPTIARGGQVHRTIFSTRIKGWFKKRERKIPTNEEIYPFLRSLLPVLCPLDLARFVTHCNRVPTSRKTRWFITLPPSKLISRLSTCRHHPTRCLSARSFPPPLTILTLFPPPLDRRPPPSFSFPCVPFIIRHPCPTPTHPGVCFESTTCTTPRRFRRARGLHFPPALLFSSLTDSSALSIFVLSRSRGSLFTWTRRDRGVIAPRTTTPFATSLPP